MRFLQQLSSFRGRGLLKTAERLGRGASGSDIARIALRKDSMNRGALAKIWDKVVFLWDALRDPAVPASAKIMLTGALLYMILPADIIPDALPPLGLLDDAAVITAVYRACRDMAHAARSAVCRRAAWEIGRRAAAEIRKMLDSYTVTLAFRAAVRLAAFAAALLILYFAPENSRAAFITTSAILAGTLLWTAVLWGASAAALLPDILLFLRQYRAVSVREKRIFPEAKRLPLSGRIYESLCTVYMAKAGQRCAEIPAFPAFLKRLRLRALFFGFSLWNRGALRGWVPDGRMLLRAVIGRLKRRLAVFAACALAYALIYYFLAARIMLRFASGYSLLQLCL